MWSVENEKKLRLCILYFVYFIELEDIYNSDSQRGIFNLFELKQELLMVLKVRVEMNIF